ncbi:MAG: hypothetical protein K2X11_16100 [Acetobacteraceae bacterium]|nr:hypothetical protein [Acetobacteraceae bacterium]
MDETRREVTVGGRFLGLGIVGVTVIVIIFLEKFGSADWMPLVKWILLGALVLGVGIPWLFFRRPVRAP